MGYGIYTVYKIVGYNYPPTCNNVVIPVEIWTEFLESDQSITRFYCSVCLHFGYSYSLMVICMRCSGLKSDTPVQITITVKLLC